MRESLLLHSTNIVVYPNILLFMGLHYFISFAVFVVQFSRCVLNGCLLCNRRLVGTSGFEPPTSRLSGVRSNHLSYAPIMLYITALKLFVFLRPLVEMRRIELLTPCLQSRCSPSWATPPYAGTRYSIVLFFRYCFQHPQNWTKTTFLNLCWPENYFMRSFLFLLCSP